METGKKMAPKAAATASRAKNVAPDKSTIFGSSKEGSNASRFGTLPRETGGWSCRPSLRKAVDVMCKSCIYDPGSGNGAWRQQVQACSSSNCPLHSVRPVPVNARKILHIVSPTGIGSVTTARPGQALTAAEIGLNDETVDERRAA